MRSISLLLSWGILCAAASLAVAAEKTEVKTVELVYRLADVAYQSLEGFLKKCESEKKFY